MLRKKRILLVEDNENLNKINRRTLELEGYEVYTAQTLAMASDLIEKCCPNAIVLDILMPDGNGVEFCEKIREYTSAPILFLTSVKGHKQALEGFRAGGDDYLVKPYSLDMLLAHIAAFFRREEIAEKLDRSAKIITKGNITLDMFAGRAFVNHTDLLLTPKEFSLLLFFVQNEGVVYTAEQIYEGIWKQPMKGDPHAIKNIIYRLRKKLDAVDSGIEILTTRKEGYVLESI
ncbi:response regulator transcription factor [Lachnospiraceae bacterium NSJ-143]|nr:response regulator transcription factor [Lachnospiraceae bacterium NSJ-143]